MADSAPIQFLEKLSARSFLVIQASMAELTRQGHSLSGSRIDVVRAGEHVVVLASPSSPVGSTPTIGVHASSQRHLTAEELGALHAHRERVLPLGGLQWRHYAAIELAVSTFQKRVPDISGYDIELISEGPSFTVLFADAQREAGAKGSQGLPGFEVALSADGRRVERANFVR
jgi:hypothetical protein